MILDNIKRQKEFAESRTLSMTFLELMKKKAERLIDEAMQKAAKEAGEVQKKAYEEGHQKGYLEGRAEARKESELLKKEQIAIMQEHQMLFKSLYEAYGEKKQERLKGLESDIIQLVVLAIEKIIREKCEDDSLLILRMIRNAVHSMEETEKLVIRLNPHEFNQLGRDYFINSLMIPDMDIVEDDTVEIHGFVIESRSGMLDGQLTVQLDSIKGSILDTLNARSI
ncbi:MAG: FliH/SctL family protein [Candidatus Xenobiia bacterium LiM19]